MLPCVLCGSACLSRPLGARRRWAGCHTSTQRSSAPRWRLLGPCWRLLGVFKGCQRQPVCFVAVSVLCSRTWLGGLLGLHGALFVAHALMHGGSMCVGPPCTTAWWSQQSALASHTLRCDQAGMSESSHRPESTGARTMAKAHESGWALFTEQVLRTVCLLQPAEHQQSWLAAVE